MPSIHDLKQSKYLTKDDVDPPVIATVSRYEEVNMAQEGQPRDMKWVLYFRELEKPMALNSTNGQLIAQITGSEDFDGWIGKRIELYNDPSVSYGGRLTGGIRVRKPAGSSAPSVGPMSKGWEYDEAVAYCIDANITKSELVASLKAAGMTGWNNQTGTPIARKLIDGKKQTPQEGLGNESEFDPDSIPF